jgi:hypothetical protein
MDILMSDAICSPFVWFLHDCWAPFIDKIPLPSCSLTTQVCSALGGFFQSICGPTGDLIAMFLVK